jgi:hypothetical protein
MGHDEMLLVMTVCELLGKSFSPKEIEKAHQKATEQLEHFQHPKPPRDAVLSHARRKE